MVRIPHFAPRDHNEIDGKYLLWADKNQGEKTTKALSKKELRRVLEKKHGVNEVTETPSSDEFRGMFGSKPKVFWEPSSVLTPVMSSWSAESDVEYKGLPKRAIVAPPEVEFSPRSSLGPCVEDTSWEGLGTIPAILKKNKFRSLLIIGPSGSGKTSLLKSFIKEIFPKHSSPLIPKGKWKPASSLVDSFKDAATAQNFLGSVGLSSVPTWCKPWECLSRGDQYRASVALELANRKRNSAVIFDEWTSVLDRGVAIGISIAMAKIIQKSAAGGDDGPWIFASCHEDVVPYLQPEYIIRCQSGQKSNIWKNTEGGLPIWSSVMKSDQAPFGGAGSQRFISSYHLADPKTTFLGLHKFGLQQMTQLDGGRGRYKMQCTTTYLKGEPLIFYANKGEPSVISCDKKEAGAPPGGQDCRLEMDKKDVVTLKVAGKKYALERDTNPILSVNRFRTDASPTNPITYSILDTDAMHSAGWYIPEGHYSKTFQGLKCTELIDTRPAYRPNIHLEEQKDGLTHLAVFVPVTDPLADATAVLDHDFLGVSVFQLPRLPPLGKFTLGAVIGSSGSGKTTLAREMFHVFDVAWNDKKMSCVNHLIGLAKKWGLSKNPRELAVELLHAVQLDESVYNRPYNTFSSGEQARAEIARVLQKAMSIKDGKPVAIEEFTSLLDRPTAKNVALGVQGICAKYKLSVVILSCHDDFIGPNLLTPDWVLQCPSRRFFRFNPDKKQQIARAPKLLLPASASSGSGAPAQSRSRSPSPRKMESLITYIERLAVRPEIKLEVRRCAPNEWQLFREHHYKDHKLSPSCSCFVGLLNGKPVVFSAWLAEPFNFISRNIADYKHASQKKDKPQTKKLEGWRILDLPNSWGPRNLYREHRTVVLPEYQGLGLGKLMCDTCAHAIASNGCMACSQTVHPHYGGYRDRSPFWRPLPSNRTMKGGMERNKVVQFAHVWVGPLAKAGYKDDKTLAKQLAESIVLQPPNPVQIRTNERFIGFRTDDFDIKHEILQDAIGVHRTGSQTVRKSPHNSSSPNLGKIPKKLGNMKATYKKRAPGLRKLQEERIARMKSWRT